MQTVEALRARIESTESLQSIVGTMKALAAMKIRQYERAVESLTDYARTIELGLYVVLRHAGRRLPEQAVEARAGIVVFGSDQGLCGRFNDEIADFTVEQLDRLGLRNEDLDVLAVGSRVAGRLAQAGLRPSDWLSLPNSVAKITGLVEEILLAIDAWREENGVQRVLLFHNRPIQRARYQPVQVQLIPVELERFASLSGEGWPTRILPTFTMERERLLAALIRQYLFVSLHRASAESLASENGSRLSSMQAAQRNIDDRLEELESRYRYLRQSTITEELLDVVAGFETLTAADS